MRRANGLTKSALSLGRMGNEIRILNSLHNFTNLSVTGAERRARDVRGVFRQHARV